MKNKEKIYEGKAKIIYKGTKPNTLIQYFKDDATAFNNKKKSIIPGKGVLNNFISELIKEGFVEGLLKKHNVLNKLSIPKIV